MDHGLQIAGAFFAIALPIYLLGWIVISIGRRKDAIGSQQHLALGFLTVPLAYLLPMGKEGMQDLRRTLLQAGNYHRKAAEEFLGLRNAGMLGLTAIAAMWFSQKSADSEQLAPQIFGFLSIFVAAYTIPTIALHSIAKMRTQRVQHALPDAVDLINMLMSGGVPLQQAISRTSQEFKSIHKDLATELAVVHHQSETGSMEIALKQFAHRIDQPEIVSLATIARHADRLGGSVTGAFQEYADSARKQRRQRAEERGNAATVKLLFPVVIFLAPSIYLLLLGPAAIELRNFIHQRNQAGGVLNQDLGEAATTIDQVLADARTVQQ